VLALDSDLLLLRSHNRDRSSINQITNLLDYFTINIEQHMKGLLAIRCLNLLLSNNDCGFLDINAEMLFGEGT